MILRARAVLPLTQPLIENGMVEIRDGKITAAGPWDGRHSVSDEVFDLGERLLLPGLINAHCHLDYTNMAGLLPYPGNFVDWIKAITALKGGWSQEEFVNSWLRGARMLVASGTTAVADIEALPELVPLVCHQVPLRVRSFLEVIGIRPGIDPETLVRDLLNRLNHPATALWSMGLSPHAPYSTTADLLKTCGRLARERGWPLTIHLAESRAEFEMFMYQQGPLWAWLKAQRVPGDCGLGSPVQHLERQGLLGPDCLAVHVNCLWEGDAGILARHGVNIVHCPRSHAYFRHERFPRQPLLEAGLNICLGTDSLASVAPPAGVPHQLSMFSELQAWCTANPDLPPEVAVHMATVNGAKALNRAGEIGEISPGAAADLIAIPFAGPAEAAWEAVTRHVKPVDASLVAGNWAIQPQ